MIYAWQSDLSYNLNNPIMIGKPMLRTCFAFFVLVTKKKKKTIKIEERPRQTKKFKKKKILSSCPKTLWPFMARSNPPPYGLKFKIIFVLIRADTVLKLFSF